MTLPPNVTLPLDPSLITSEDPQELYSYIKKLVYATAAHLQEANLSANGNMFTFTDVDSPYEFIQGSTDAGTATYADTIVFVRRTNLMTYVWFDINWTGHTGTGNTLVVMPYFAQFVAQFPFVCVIEADNITFDAGYTYLTGNLTPNTNTIVVDENGSALPILPLPLPADGHLRGSIFYAGQQGQ